MTQQPGLFDAPPKPSAKAAPSAPDLTLAQRDRLAFLAAWANLSSPSGYQMRQFWCTMEPWQREDVSDKAHTAAVRKLERRVSWKAMTDRQRLEADDALLPFAMYRFRNGKVTTELCAPRRDNAVMPFMDAWESAGTLAMMANCERDVVMKWVMTGEVRA